MKIKPAEHRIHVQFHFPPEDDIILPSQGLSTKLEDKRTRVECLDIGANVMGCKVGDFLLLHEDTLRLAVPITKEPPTALIHDSMVIALVLDDAQHVR